MVISNGSNNKGGGVRQHAMDSHPNQPKSKRACSQDVIKTILVFQSNESAVMLVCQTNPVGVQLFPYVNTLFCFTNFTGHVSENALYTHWTWLWKDQEFDGSVYTVSLGRKCKMQAFLC